MENLEFKSQKEIELDFSKEKIKSLEEFYTLLESKGAFDSEEDQKKLEDMEREIKTLNQLIVQYKEDGMSKVQIEKEIDELENELKKINEAIDGSADLINFRRRIEIEINKFVGFIESGDINLANSIKSRRIKKVSENLAAIKKEKQENYFIKKNNINTSTVGKGILALIILQVFFSIVFYLVSQQIQILNAGFISLLINFILFTLLNFNKNKQLAIKKAASIPTLDFENFNQDKNENEILVNAAWIDALKYELENVDKTIHNRLRLAGVDKNSQNILNINSRIIKLKKEVDNYYKNSLSPEDLLKLKRKKDILEIEKEVLEESINENKRHINIYNISKLDKNLSQLIYNYIEKLNSKFNIRIIDNSVNKNFSSVNTKKKLFTSLVIAIFFFSPILIPFKTAYAKTAKEIQEEIDNQNAKLQETEDKLQNAENELKLSQDLLAQSSEGVPKIEAEIKKIEAEISVNSAELKVIEDKKELLTLQREEKKIIQKTSLKSSYMEWRAESDTANIVADEENNALRNQRYGAILLGIETNELNTLVDEVQTIEKDISQYEKKLAKLNSSNDELVKKKEELQAQITYFASVIANNSELVVTLESNLNQIASQIDFLSYEQLEAIRREQEILNQPGNVISAGCDGSPVQGGQFYLCGNGRDLPMGHGVGMSQYGAKGAAEQGYSATAILQFYYNGATVVDYPVSSQITIKYCQDDPVNDPYQDGGCNDGRAPVTERIAFDSYLAGIGEMPTSWPIEARKAQIIAARTYAVRYTNNGDSNIPICLSTYCQVSYVKSNYNGENDVVQATKNKVITYGGALIEALYSADNNQGYGTADAGTRFQDIYGNPSSNAGYLTSVNDNAFAANSRLYWNYYCGDAPCGLWTWKTSAYNYSHIDEMLNYGANNISGAVGTMKAQIGNVAGLTFERDASSRVKKVIILGSNGNTTVMGGWWFKYIWNAWMDSRGGSDFIYSQTFFIK